MLEMYNNENQLGIGMSIPTSVGSAASGGHGDDGASPRVSSGKIEHNNGKQTMQLNDIHNGNDNGNFKKSGKTPRSPPSSQMPREKVTAASVGPVVAPVATPTGQEKNAKRMREVDSSFEDLDDLSSMKKIGDSLRRYLLTDSSKVSKTACDFIMGKVSEYEELIMRTMLNNERLTGQLEEVRKQKPVPVISTSYAGVVASAKVKPSATPAKSPKISVPVVPPQRFAVVVTSIEPGQDGDMVKKSIASKVQCKLPNVRIKSLTKRKDGVAIETCSQKELDDILKCVAFKDAGLTATVKPKPQPRVLIFDVPTDIEEKALIDQVYLKNLKDKGISQEDYVSHAKIISRGKNGEKGNMVLQINSRCAELLDRQGRVFVGWQSLKVRRHLAVSRCLKCCGYRHFAKSCKAPDKLCLNCGQTGHLASACKNATVCINCKKEGRDSGHSVLSRECPVYVRMMGAAL